VPFFPPCFSWISGLGSSFVLLWQHPLCPDKVHSWFLVGESSSLVAFVTANAPPFPGRSGKQARLSRALVLSACVRATRRYPMCLNSSTLEFSNDVCSYFLWTSIEIKPLLVLCSSTHVQGNVSRQTTFSLLPASLSLRTFSLPPILPWSFPLLLFAIALPDATPFLKCRLL